MKVEVSVASEIVQTARVVQLSGLFDIPPSKRAELTWSANLPVEERTWNVGLVVGPSGCGKSTIARKLWPEQMAARFDWPADRSVIDAFPSSMGIKDIVDLLSSVGFSSPPSWMRPFGVLSNGEQFRVSLARLLAESPRLAVVDEFTSVVDRTVAQIGSAALAKTVRRRGAKFVAVTCHEDVVEWLQPDWIYRPDVASFGWRELQRRPPIELVIQRVHHTAWRQFAKHHYLSRDINKAACCFVAFWRGRPVAFHCSLPFFGRTSDGRKARRNHRTVCLPDYQGVGIGNALSDFCSSLWAGLGYRVLSTTSHPAHMRKRAAGALWRLTRAPGLTARDVGGSKSARAIASSRATDRLTAGFEYVGPKLDRTLALGVMNTWAREH
jgi:hypothetical protein